MKNEFIYLDGNAVYWLWENYFSGFGFWFSNDNINLKHFEKQITLFRLTNIVTSKEHEIIKEIRDEIRPHTR